MHHRIHVEAITPSVEVKGDEFHHAIRVVRIRQGEMVEVFDGKGQAARGRVEAIESNLLRIAVLAPIPSRESPLRIHLAPAIIQLEKFELILQKAIELGAASITPLVADRGEIRPERYRGKQERWEKIVLEAVKQSGRAVVPALNVPATFDDVAKKSGPRIVFDADEEPHGDAGRVDEMTILVGPEGGWSEREIALAKEAGCAFARLGPRRLRAETAAIVALSVIASRYGDI